MLTKLKKIFIENATRILALLVGGARAFKEITIHALTKLDTFGSDKLTSLLRFAPYCVVAAFTLSFAFVLVFYAVYAYDHFVLTKSQQFIAKTRPVYLQVVQESWQNRLLVNEISTAFQTMLEWKMQKVYKPAEWIILEEEHWWRQGETIPYYYGPDWTVYRGSGWWRWYQKMCECKPITDTTNAEHLATFRGFYDASLKYRVGAPEQAFVDTMLRHFERGTEVATRYRDLHEVVEGMQVELEAANDRVAAINAKDYTFPLKTWKVFTVVSVAAVAVIWVSVSVFNTALPC